MRRAAARRWGRALLLASPTTSTSTTTAVRRARRSTAAFAPVAASNRGRGRRSTRGKGSSSGRGGGGDGDAKNVAAEVSRLHEAAVRDGKMFYTDPKTGFQVFTRLAHLKRGKCCGSGCRHCPYPDDEDDEDDAVPPARAAGTASAATRIPRSAPAYLHRRRVAGKEPGGPRGAPPPRCERDVLFFSSGKDSLLALRKWLRMRQAAGDSAGAALGRLTLLTTFHSRTGVIAHQETHIQDVVRQARHLNLDLVGVPLHPRREYKDHVGDALDLIKAEAKREEEGAAALRLIFGDLHLEHVRGWRDIEMASLTGRDQLVYPLFNESYAALLDDLEASGVPCVVSSVHPPEPSEEAKESTPGRDRRCPLRVNDLFGRGAARRCEERGWDAFGENGEFHTLARVWDVSSDRALGMVASDPSGCEF